MEKVSVDKRKADIAAYDAETKRLQALGLTMLPEAAAALGLQTAQQAMTGPDILPPEQAPQQAPQQPMPSPEQMQQMAMAQQAQMEQQQQSQPMPQGAPPEGMM